MDKFITYDGLPIKSGGAHSLGKISMDDAFLKTNSFLKNHTSSETPSEIKLTIYESPNQDYDAIKVKRRASKIFGLFPKKGIGYLSGKQIRYWIWTVKTENFEKAFNFVRENNLKIQQELGPIEISFLWIFKFKSSETGDIFPDQDKIPQLDIRQKNSQIYLKLSNKSTLSAWFAFPFANYDSNFEKIIDKMQTDLPFRFSDKNWRQWTLSKNNNWTSRKIIKNAG